jgi:hypothetical protein
MSFSTEAATRSKEAGPPMPIASPIRYAVIGAPPAGATTLIVSLGILTEPKQLGVLMFAVLLLVLQGYVINRLAGIEYPRWSPIRG